MVCIAFQMVMVVVKDFWKDKLESSFDDYNCNQNTDICFDVEFSNLVDYKRNKYRNADCRVGESFGATGEQDFRINFFGVSIEIKGESVF